MAVAGYNIYLDGVKQNASLVTDLNYALSSLTAETSYGVTVSAVDDAGNESAQSAAVNFTTTAASSALLLDTYPGAKRVYWINDRLRSDYTGFAIQARTGSETSPVYQDIGFVDNKLDTAALLAFAGTGSAFISKIYDQGTDGVDWVSPTPDRDPKIVVSGTLITKNGIPVADTTSSNVYDLAALFATTAVCTDFTAATNDNSFGVVLASQNISYYSGAAHQDSTTTVLSGDVGTPSIYVDGTLFTGNRGELWTAINPDMRIISTTNLNLGSFTEIHLNPQDNTTIRGLSHFMGKIIYASDQSANRVDIEAILTNLLIQ